MPAAKKRIHRQGEPDVSPLGACCFAVAFMALGACAAELARVICACLLWP
jgi:hypothetical protein